MEKEITISSIRNALQDLRAKDQEFVSIDALLEYLDNLEKESPSSTEFEKLLHESRLAHYRATHETQLEMFKSVIEAGRTALNSCILVNGGATVALLAYLGNFLSKNPGAAPSPYLVKGLGLFAAAVLCAAVATGFRYLSQFVYSQDWDKTGTGFNIATVVLAAIAYVLFGFGSYAAYQAFT